MDYQPRDTQSTPIQPQQRPAKTAPLRLRRNNRMAGGFCMIAVGLIIAFTRRDAQLDTFADSITELFILLIAIGFGVIGVLLLILSIRLPWAGGRQSAVASATNTSIGRRTLSDRLPFLIAVTPPLLILLSFCINAVNSLLYDAGLLGPDSVVTILDTLGTYASLIGFGTFLPAIIAAVIVHHTQGN